jgi:hypothetical protein
MKLNEDNKYLLTNLLALFALTLILWGVNLNYSTLNYIILGFCWNLTLRAPSLREKVLLRKYRFSLLKFIFRLDSFLSSISENQYIQIALRSLPPLVISLCTFFISGNGWFVLTLVGSAYFELIHYFKLRLNTVE